MSANMISFDGDSFGVVPMTTQKRVFHSQSSSFDLPDTPSSVMTAASSMTSSGSWIDMSYSAPPSSEPQSAVSSDTSPITPSSEHDFSGSAFAQEAYRERSFKLIPDSFSLQPNMVKNQQVLQSTPRLDNSSERGDNQPQYVNANELFNDQSFIDEQYQSQENFGSVPQFTLYDSSTQYQHNEHSFPQFQSPAIEQSFPHFHTPNLDSAFTTPTKDKPSRNPGHPHFEDEGILTQKAANLALYVPETPSSSRHAHIGTSSLFSTPSPTTNSPPFSVKSENHSAASSWARSKCRVSVVRRRGQRANKSKRGDEKWSVASGAENQFRCQDPSCIIRECSAHGLNCPKERSSCKLALNESNSIPVIECPECSHGCWRNPCAAALERGKKITDKDGKPQYRSTRSFRRLEHLKRHMRTHTEVRDSPCPIPSCHKHWREMALNRGDNLSSHIKTHCKEGGRNSYCPELVEKYAPPSFKKPAGLHELAKRRNMELKRMGKGNEPTELMCAYIAKDGRPCDTCLNALKKADISWNESMIVTPASPHNKA